MGIFDYNPKDFGADSIKATENWKGSGYTHYTAYSKSGGQVSWNEAETTENGGTRYVENIHASDGNMPKK